MLEKLKEIESCNYVCEAGPLENNQKYIEFKHLLIEQQKQIKHLEKVNMMAIHIMTDKQNDKLISLLEKKN